MYYDSTVKYLDNIKHSRQRAAESVEVSRVSLSFLNFPIPKLFPEAWDLLSESCTSRLSLGDYHHCFEDGDSVPWVICYLLTLMVSVQQ